MSRDYYAEVEEICEDLERSGRGDLADDLRGAVEAGSTATEILMAVRWSLEKMLAAESELGGLEPRMRSLKEDLEVVLR
jgi:hypothetical protein